MRALYYREKGAAGVLRTGSLPDPQPAAGEVLVRIAYSGINPSDVKSRAGVSSAAMDYPLIVPHSDGAGTVEAIGAGVDPAWLGARVWLHNGQWKRQFGTAAEYVALGLDHVALLPDNVPFDIGAAIGIPLMTAMHAVTAYGNLAGKTVLVSGGAGSVGFYAIQLAKLQGARVVSTVGSPAKGRAAAAAGADLVLSYREDDVAAGVQAFTDGRGADAIIEVDAAANAGGHGALLAFDGHIIVYGSSDAVIPTPFRPMMAVFANLHFFIVYLLPLALRRHYADRINALLADGRLIHRIDRVYTLEEAAEAHRRVEEGANGKVLLSL
ncbi:MAG TPA: NADPH:quinone reductase [Paucimonas sp.]|nr:NADPH:quinone reductase [Paucimonas sp.]